MDHAKEMGSKADRVAPFWFFKPSTSYLSQNSGPIQLPSTAVVHHEGIKFIIHLYSTITSI